MKYYIIDGKTGDILRKSNTTEGLPDVWGTITGSEENYYTYIELLEDREEK